MLNLNLRSSPKTFLLAGAWLLAVICAVGFAQKGWESWERGREDLQVAQDRLSRLHGWLADEQDLDALEKKALGPLAGVPSSGWSWTGLEGLQSAAQKEGLEVKEMRPSETAVQGNRTRTLYWDVRLEGPIGPLGKFLEGIPSQVPGVRLESLQLLPRQGAGIQALIRLSLPVKETS